MNGRFQLILTSEIDLEYEKILGEHAAPGAKEYTLNIFSESEDVIYKLVSFHWYAITSDPDDNKFYDAALLLVQIIWLPMTPILMRRKGLLSQRITIVSADEFLLLLSNSEKTLGQRLR